MMTREEYILKKYEIDYQMKKTRISEHTEKAALNENYELCLRDLKDSYHRKRQALLEERDAKRMEISDRFKDQRRALWTEDCELVSRWRSQLDNVELTPSDGGERTNEKGGAL